jgi:hypothetical protein
MTRKHIDKKCKPPEDCVDLTLSIFTDDYPEETSVKTVELNSMTWIWSDETFEYPNEEYSLQQCVDPSGCYDVFIMDKEGTGIEGNEFELTYDNYWITGSLSILCTSLEMDAHLVPRVKCSILNLPRMNIRAKRCCICTMSARIQSIGWTQKFAEKTKHTISQSVSIPFAATKWALLIHKAMVLEEVEATHCIMKEKSGTRVNMQASQIAVPITLGNVNHAWITHFSWIDFVERVSVMIQLSVVSEELLPFSFKICIKKYCSP